VAHVGGDWMPFGRFIIPVIPILVCLLAAGAWALFKAASAQPRVVRIATVILGVVAQIWVGLALDRRIRDSAEGNSRIQEAQQQIDKDRGYQDAARLLAAALPPGARLVTDYPGTMAYYTDAYIIDMWGLATPLIAREGNTNDINPIYGRTCPACYPRLEPEFFHVRMPIVRDRFAFTNAKQVVGDVWQSEAIGHFVNLRGDFLVGRVVEQSTGKAVYFLERRKSTPLAPRPVAAGFVIEYPFEPRK
jgi:hypothetical protein